MTACRKNALIVTATTVKLENKLKHLKFSIWKLHNEHAFKHTNWNGVSGYLIQSDWEVIIIFSWILQQCHIFEAANILIFIHSPNEKRHTHTYKEYSWWVMLLRSVSNSIKIYLSFDYFKRKNSVTHNHGSSAFYSVVANDFITAHELNVIFSDNLWIQWILRVFWATLIHNSI